MAKRRISKQRMREIAERRMDTLLAMAYREAAEGRPERARRYVDLARRIGMRTRTPVPRTVRHCKGCLSPMVPGMNCRVRIGRGRVAVHCLDCGAVRRTPYIKEKRANDREGSEKGTA